MVGGDNDMKFVKNLKEINFQLVFSSIFYLPNTVLIPFLSVVLFNFYNKHCEKDNVLLFYISHN